MAKPSGWLLLEESERSERRSDALAAKETKKVAGAFRPPDEAKLIRSARI
jgi:hypothetical protein